MDCPKCGGLNSESSKFCNHCGQSLLEPVQENAKMDGSSKKIGWIAGGILLVCAAVFLMIMLLNTDVAKFKRAINDGSYKEAVGIYEDKIMEKPDDKKKAEDFIQNEIDKIVASFKEKKTDYETANSELEALKSAKVISGKVSEASSAVTRLNDSRTAYAKGAAFLNEKNIKAAIPEFKKVIQEDADYNAAQESMKNSIQTYKEAILKEIDESAQSNDFAKAITMIGESLSLIPDDPEISAKKAVYEKANEEKKAAERKEKLEDAKKKQEVTVESSTIIAQSSEYKTLYPDMIQVHVRNNTEKTVKNIKVASLGYDGNGLPIKIKSQFGSADSEFKGIAENVNIIPNATYGKGKGWSLDDPHGIKTVLSCVSEVEYYDGSKWMNPYYEYWLEEYKEKPLKQ
ncbi:DUF5780 domain-containing protein [Paenibacillus lutrae]|uniref:Zinc ribbon domain-containing protein n=1 Tax=Paenibacillus lutrae TaxID=2078573 RepID=A0A7X3JYB9_9BACL|nr:DUF5780 domain-containing protein [Paenibacillus lutrae]MVO98794.1 zinc ribbon domain-containing protein [Paenibacillus lutrae]